MFLGRGGLTKGLREVITKETLKNTSIICLYSFLLRFYESDKILGEGSNPNLSLDMALISCAKSL